MSQQYLNDGDEKETRPRPADELKGLVYSLTPKPEDPERVWYRKPTTLAVIVILLTVLLNIIFA